jgi:O-acetylhomoserine (thiol)-lyase
MTNPQWKPETIAVHGGYSPDPTTRAVAVPIYQTVAYAFDDTQHGADLFDLKVQGNIYTRIMNPTTDVLEKRIAALEGGIGALALASGQAAITYAIQTIAEAGDNILASSALYGGTYNLFAHTLPQFGIHTRFADYRDPQAFAALIDARTKAVFVESIGNPRGNITDIEAIARIAHAHGDRRQHRGHAVSAAPVRFRRRYRRALFDQVSRRPWHQPWRCHRRFRSFPVG